MTTLIDRAKDAVHALEDDGRHLRHKIASKLEAEKHSHTHLGHLCHALHHTVHNRFHSFAPPRSQNNAKWHVDGASYFWALSETIESAKSQIWIMDWWLSPELYLRRPPAKWEGYRLDRMLQKAAQRGVKVNVMVYKEVENVLTLDSIHTKHALEALHENIAVFRHPDHNPSGRNLAADFKNLFVSPHDEESLAEDGEKALYGFSDDVVLYWAHHEKLCLIDGKIAFMGGLDACFGRWDTNQHAIADAHPTNLDEIIFPGQDFNNARVFDFQNVEDWKANKLDRTKYSRMGWSDLSVSLQGPIIEDLGAHFVQRWNYIYHSKYCVLSGGRYKALSLGTSATKDATYHPDGTNVHFGVVSQKLAGFHGHAEVDKDIPQPAGAFPASDNEPPHHMFQSSHNYLHSLHSRFRRGFDGDQDGDAQPVPGAMDVQLVRSISRWSHGMSLEHSIANAYIHVIKDSQHFIYIENQFFITATSNEQSPIQNKIGGALVERILRAANSGEKFKVIVCMPSVPAFAGDLRAESSQGTLAIMSLQYNSICRGGYSIMESIAKAGYDPKEYIRFYNLRNYDRINISAAMTQAEEQSGVSYEAARKEHDDLVNTGSGDQGGINPSAPSGTPSTSQYEAYQAAASNIATTPGTTQDTISNAYMLNGPALLSIPWTPAADNNATSEIDMFVSEELYIHTKCLIADDTTVILGSANLNDRSQLGYHDSEIAIVVNDPETVESKMAGQPHQASRFAASLRRQLVRKHLGLVPAQDLAALDQDPNARPVGAATELGNRYDWASPPDLLVQDPLDPAFEALWTGTAATNTAIFERVFRPVPSDSVRNWKQYEDFYAKHFIIPGADPKKAGVENQGRYEYGHVFKGNFSQGEEGVKEVKEALGGVKGSLVEMPLAFLEEVGDLVELGVGYNILTEDIYT